MIHRVFLSSTANDLFDWREKVRQRLDEIEKIKVIYMRNWAAEPRTSMKVCEEKVKSSDIFVGLIGHCFGSSPESRPDRSYTMLEFDWAVEADLPRLMHIAGKSVTVSPDLIECDRKRKLQKQFREEDTAGWHTGQPDSWQNADRLAADVERAVLQQIDAIPVRREVDQVFADLETCMREREDLRTTVRTLASELQKRS